MQAGHGVQTITKYNIGLSNPGGTERCLQADITVAGQYEDSLTVIILSEKRSVVLSEPRLKTKGLCLI